jgi:hypothetical protein
LQKAVEFAFGVTVKLEQVDPMWSLVFSREDGTDMKRVYSFFSPHGQFYSYYVAGVKCP